MVGVATAVGMDDTVGTDIVVVVGMTAGVVDDGDTATASGRMMVRMGATTMDSSLVLVILGVLVVF